MATLRSSIFDDATVARVVDASPTRRLDVEHPGILLGRDASSWVWSGHQRSTLVLGPTRSGKTSTVIIPNVIAAPGAVVTTSTKHDVLAATHRARSHCGAALLFDPSGTSETPKAITRVGWTPLVASASWDGALEMATSMVAASQRRSRQGPASDHWSERAGALLATLLFAAPAANASMATVLQWVDRHHGHDALEGLESRVGSDHPAPALLAGILATDSREQSGIWSTTSGVLAAYRSLGALGETNGPSLDPEAFVNGAHTLYICAPARQQALTAPLVVGMLSQIQTAAYRRNNPASPVVFALDELANIAPLPDLPQLVSEGGGQGVLTIGCLQDLSQARTRWGAQADGFLSLFSTTLVLGGVADRSTLRSLSELAGERDAIHPSHAVSRDPRGRRSESVTFGLRRQPRVSIDEIARGRDGHGIVLDAQNRLDWVRLTVAHRDAPWRALTRARSIDPVERSL